MNLNIPIYITNTRQLGHFDESEFEDLYNNETIYPAPPWYGNSISSKYFKAKKGSYLLDRDEIEKELIKFSQSEDLLNDHKKWNEVIWVYNRENIKAQLYLDKN